jgi:D-sedoheptulose 7-phosphate isomerase
VTLILESNDPVLDYSRRVTSALASFDFSQISRFVPLLQSARRTNNLVLIAGNGGSSSTASHYAIDWMLGTELSDPSLRVLSLSDNSGSITATGNDLDFVRIFARQIEKIGRKGDILILVSASGNSQNLVAAHQAAKKLEMVTCAITGFGGGKLRRICDYSIHVNTEEGDYGVAEDLHLMIGHVVKEVLIAEAKDAD